MVRNGMQIETSKANRKRLHPEEREKRGGKNVGRGHAFAYLISDKLFDAHPEYFALIDDKRVKQAVPGMGARYQPLHFEPEGGGDNDGQAD